MSSLQSDAARLRQRYPDVVEFGLVYAVLVALPVAQNALTQVADGVDAAAPADWPPVGIIAVAVLWYLVGMGGVAVVYARISNVSLPVSLPGQSEARTLGVAVFGPVAVLAVVVVLAHGVLDSTMSEVVRQQYNPRVGPGFLALTAVLPNLAAGVGFGLLFNGAIQERLRTTYTPAVATVAVASVAGFYRWVALGGSWTGPALVLALAVTGLVVATGFVPVVVDRMERDESVRAALTPGRAAVVALAGLLLFGLTADAVSGATAAPELVDGLSWLAAFAVAAVCHERTRSVWVPALVVTVFAVLRSLLPYAEAVVGLVPPP